MSVRYPSLAHRKQKFKRAEAEMRRAVREAAAPVEVAGAEVSYAPGLLPDLPGYVHGIVALEPVVVVQCDGCGRVAVGQRGADGRRSLLVILTCGITFGDFERDPRRLCARCRVGSGRRDFDTQQLRTDPSRLAYFEQQMSDAAGGVSDV